MEKRKLEFLNALANEADEYQGINAHVSQSEQDQRLSTKHIRTLTFLQDIVNENKQLKAKVEQLEVSFFTVLIQYQTIHTLSIIPVLQMMKDHSV